MIRMMNCDCMDFMKSLPDKAYQLAIVDVNYGIGVNHNMGRRKGDKKSEYKPAYWDRDSPDVEYFNELFRVSINQIIWGANHFITKIPNEFQDSPCWIMWDKGFSQDVTFAQFELALTSFDGTCKKYNYNAAANVNRIHPTQKPVALYKWLLTNYAKPGDRILDTHGGSGSIAIACYDLGFDLDWMELDKDYYNAAVDRYEAHVAKYAPAHEHPVNKQGQSKLF